MSYKEESSSYKAIHTLMMVYERLFSSRQHLRAEDHFCCEKELKHYIWRVWRLIV